MTKLVTLSSGDHAVVERRGHKGDWKLTLSDGGNYLWMKPRHAPPVIAALSHALTATSSDKTYTTPATVERTASGLVNIRRGDKYVSLTPEDAITVTNAIIDLIESQ